MIVLMLAALTAVTMPAPASAGVTAAAKARPVAGKAPLNDLIGQPVRHVTPPPEAKRALSKPQAPKLPRGQRSACPVPAKPGQPGCSAIFRTSTAKNAKAGATAGTATDGVKAGSVSPAAATASGFSPAQLRSAYGLTTASTTGGLVNGTIGTPVVVAITTAFDYPTAANDLAAYRANYGMIPCIGTSALASQYSLPLGSGCVTKVNATNQASPLPAAPASSDPDYTFVTSAQMDMVTAICPNCEILLVEGNYNDVNMDQAIVTGENDADIVVGGWYDEDTTDQMAKDQLYLNTPGKAIVFPTLSTGTSTTWPADSQYVTAVGGTTLTSSTSSSRGWTETAWSDGGGGCSTLEPKPAWQTADNSSPNGCLNRTANDVSAVADPNTPVAIYDSTAALNGDGRSVDWVSSGSDATAAAIIAGVYALNGLPQAGTYPASYPYQSGVSGDFNDVTSGSDGTCESNRQYLCNGETGYDAPTGAGTPNGASGLAFGSSGDTVTVPDPGVKDYAWGDKADIPVQAVDSDSSQTLTYTASGLPNGLAINSATGAITGTVPSTGGTSAVTVTATDASGASGSVTFNIVAVRTMGAGHYNVNGQFSPNAGGVCLNDGYADTDAGAPLSVYKCSASSTTETWGFRPVADPGGAGKLVLGSDTTKCLAMTGASAGSKSEMEPCDGSAGQQWLMKSGGELYNPVSHLCLTDPGDATANNTQLDLETCADSAGQQWTPPAGEINSGTAGCLDDAGNATANNTKADYLTCNGAAGQNWIPKTNSALSVQGVCLDMTKGSTLDGGTAEIFTCNGGTNQEWVSGPQGEIINVNSGKCLDDPGDSTTAGTQLVQEDCYGQAGELWQIS